MSGFTKLIKNLLGGILSFFVGLFGGKKSEEKQLNAKPSAELPGKVTGKTRRRSGYFLELDESEQSQPAEAKQPAATTNGAKTSKPAVASQPAKKEEPAKTPEPATAQAASVELVQTAEGVKAQPAEKPAKKQAASTNGQQQTETTFAPKYLAPSANISDGRRRPGPNMNSFLDMARQVKTPG